MRRDYASDWAAVCGSVCMPTNVFIDWASVQASATANTIEAFPLHRVLQYIGSAIVQQYYNHFFRAIGFTRLPGSADDAIIRGDFLACSKRAEQRPEQCKISETGNHFFDPHNNNMRFRKG